MPLTKRVMVLFDPERHQRLEKEAKHRNCSVGALIREAVAREVLEKGEISRNTKLEAAKQLISMEEDVPDWEEIEKFIAQGHSNE